MIDKTQIKGTIKNLFVKPAHGAPMQSKSRLLAIAGKGLQGDQAFGRQSRQVLLVDDVALTTLELQPGDFRENVTLTGLPIDSLPPGSRLQSGDVILKIVAVCTPCEKLEQIRTGLMEASEGARGMLAIVEQGGELIEGASIRSL